jgi:hypothetical protein
MSRIFALLITLSFAVGSVFAQEAACPQIIIDGPTDLGQQGEPQPYSVRVMPSENLPVLSYLWSVTTQRGEVGMVRGQGTSTIQVPWNQDFPSVSIKIGGLPDGCSNTAALDQTQMGRIYDPVPVDKYVSKSFNDDKAALDNLAIIVSAGRPDWKGFIVLEFKKNTTEATIRKKVESIRNFLYVTRKHPQNRFVILVERSGRLHTTLWRMHKNETPCTECKVY